MKKVYISSHGPLYYPHVKCGWEDVWLRVCSGRRTLRLAPCLVSRKHLESDIWLYKKIADDPEAKTREWHRERAIELEGQLAQVDRDGLLVDHTPFSARKGTDPGKAFALGEVMTKADWIDRAEAERMLDFYLGLIGLRNCVYKWKRPDFVAWPTTLDIESATAED